MKRIITFLTTISIAFFVLTGCSPSYDHFNLKTVENDHSNFEQPYLFIVAPPEDKNKVGIYYHEGPKETERSQEEFQTLKDVTVTDKMIVIETEDETFTFERLSESVAVGEGEIWYDFSYPENK